MSAMAVWRVEMRRMMVKPLAWLLAALTMGWLGWRFTLRLGEFLGMQIKLNALADGPGFTDLVAVPQLAELVYLAFIVVPLMTMGLLASDRRQGTLALLSSTGVGAGSIVAGKYLAVMSWLTAWLLLALAMPLALAGSTHLDAGKLAASALATWLLLGTLAAIGLACSAVTAYAALAATGTLIVSLMLWNINAGARAAGVDVGFVDWLAMSGHWQLMMRGVVTSRELVWFVLAAGVALALATRRLATDGERN
jgi:ABC-2 type transport system permease protein